MSQTVNYSKLADELEVVANSGPVACDDVTRKRLLQAVKDALPELEKQDDVAQRVLYTVSAPMERLADTALTQPQEHRDHGCQNWLQPWPLQKTRRVR